MALTGRVLRPGDPGWDEARRGFNKRIDYDAETPRMVVFCQDRDDVVSAVRWARQEKVPIRVRSGRHDYEGYSSRVPDGLIIDVSEMDSMKVDGAGPGTVVVGPGKEMLFFVQHLWEHGRTVPVATGPTVGIAGLALGGGFGVTSRKFGLTCDNLLRLEMVDAAGEVTYASPTENPNLFWACKGGGGGNFGVVTSLSFRTYPVSYVASFYVAWPWDHFDKLVDCWQRVAPGAKEGISSILSLSVEPKIRLLGQFTPDDGVMPTPSDVDEVLAPMIHVAKPESASVHIEPFIKAARAFSGLDKEHPHWAVQVHSDQEMGKSTSALAYEAFGPDAITTLKGNLKAVPRLRVPPPQPSTVQLLAGGGAVSEKRPDETAVFHRKAKFVVQYNSFWTAQEDGQETIDWIVRFREAMLQNKSTRGAYVNYQDSTIKDWLREYYGSNLEKLIEVKQTIDPDNVFKFPQSIPLPEP